MDVLLTTLNAKYSHTSLALRYLAGYCRRRSVLADVTVMEFTINNNLLEVVERIFAAKPAVVGLACYIWNIEFIKRLTAVVRKVLPDAVIICGGPEVSYTAAEFLTANPAVDYVICGEGEAALAELLIDLAAGRPPAANPAIARRTADGALDGTPATMPELAAIPFAYTAAELETLGARIIYYESSRGCPFSCRYCLSSATRGVREWPLERVLTELKAFIDARVRQVKFVDRTFNARRERCMAIWDFLRRQDDCPTNFHFEIAVDLLDDAALALLERMPAGRVQLEIGVQSTNENTLKAIDRHNDWPKIVNNVGRLLAAGNIHLHLDLIIGLPFEDRAAFARSFNDVYALTPHMLQLGFLKLLRGSLMRRDAERYGYVYMDDAPYQVLANDFMNHEDMAFLYYFEDVFEQFYNSGNFKRTLAYLVECGGDAFVLYEALTRWSVERGWHLAAHGLAERYRHLWEFINERGQADAAVAAELLKFDALQCERGGCRPEFLPWNGACYRTAADVFWRDKARDYLPDFVFTNWRAVRKRFHIEVFACDVAGDLPPRRRLTALLFDYGGEGVKYRQLDAADFEEE